MPSGSDLIDHSQIVHKTSAKIVCEKYFRPANTSSFQNAMPTAVDERDGAEYNGDDTSEQKYRKQTSSVGTKVQT